MSKKKRPRDPGFDAFLANWPQLHFTAYKDFPPEAKAEMDALLKPQHERHARAQIIKKLLRDANAVAQRSR